MPRNAWRWTVNRWGQQFLKCRIIGSNDNDRDDDTYSFCYIDTVAINIPANEIFSNVVKPPKNP